jgi:protocatechuate 3,4-dioxygenase beta subunit
MAPRWIRDVDRQGPLRLEGQVLDEAGDPVGGATITLGSVPPRTTTSEADGGFAFDKIVGREYALSAIAGKRVGGPMTHHLTATSDPAVIRLVPGAKLVVTVVDVASKPVPKASVKLIGMTDRAATTGDDGVATLDPVHPGWVSVQVSAAGFAAGNAFKQIGGSGATGTVTITLRAGFSVSGRVIDDKGNTISGAQVTTAGVWDLPGSGDRTETDARGRFTIAALAPGTHVLVASDGEHAPARSTPVVIESRPVDGVELVMQAGGAIRGRVFDHAGVAAVFATVRVAGDRGQAGLVDSRQTTTDKDGNFEITGLARTQLKIRAESDVAASEVVPVDLTTQAERAGLELKLSVSGTIAGRVVDEAGQPVPEVQVNAFPDILGGSQQESLVLAGMSSATTDGGGRFTIHGLPDGEYRLRAARSSGRGRFDWGQQGVKARTGDANVSITLAAPGSVTGKLVLENGIPPALAHVQLGYQPQEASLPDGSFTLTDVTPGTYDLHARGAEFAELTKQDVIVSPGKPTDVGTLTLTRGRKITGRVVDASGNAVGGARVKSGDMMYTMQGAEDQMASFEELYGMKSSITDRDGNFTLVGIGKKRTSVMAETAKGRSNAVEIPAGADDPPPVALTLRGFGRIVGKVTSQGKPVGAAAITVTPKGGGSQVQVAQSEADGSFTLANVPEGTVVLSVMQQSQMNMSIKTASTEAVVTAGKQTKVTVDIPVGAVTLTVQVKALPGNKVDSAQIFLMRGAIAIKNAKELTELFLGGSAVGMKFWLGEGKPLPEFDELVPGGYSVCTIPITGDLNDTTFQQRLQQNTDILAVYCKQAKVAPSPTKQTFVHDVPAMPPLPSPAP